MKYFGCLVSRVTTVGVALGVAALVSAVHAEIKEGKATVRAVRGSADYSQGGGGFKTLGVGTVLKPGAVVRTAPDSQVDLFLDVNGPVVRIAADSVVGIDRLEYEKTGADTVIDTQLDLKSGAVMGRVNKMAAASKYDVKTPTGVCGIRGTDYHIEATGRVTVRDGEVSVTYNGKTYIVHSGETFDPTIPGVRPATPEELRFTVPGPEVPSVVVIEPGTIVYVSPLVGAQVDDGYTPPPPDPEEE